MARTHDSLLTDDDRRLLASALALAALDGRDVREVTGFDDDALAYSAVFGRAQALLGQLAAAVGRLGGEEAPWAGR